MSTANEESTNSQVDSSNYQVVKIQRGEIDITLAHDLGGNSRRPVTEATVVECWKNGETVWSTEKDTCCTVRWMTVSGDWDSLSSCMICSNPSSCGCQAIIMLASTKGADDVPLLGAVSASRRRCTAHLGTNGTKTVFVRSECQRTVWRVYDSNARDVSV